MVYRYKQTETKTPCYFYIRKESLTIVNKKKTKTSVVHSTTLGWCITFRGEEKAVPIFLYLCVDPFHMLQCPTKRHTIPIE